MTVLVFLFAFLFWGSAEEGFKEPGPSGRVSGRWARLGVRGRAVTGRTHGGWVPGFKERLNGFFLKVTSSPRRSAIVWSRPPAPDQPADFRADVCRSDRTSQTTCTCRHWHGNRSGCGPPGCGLLQISPVPTRSSLPPCGVCLVLPLQKFWMWRTGQNGNLPNSQGGGGIGPPPPSTDSWSPKHLARAFCAGCFWTHF